MKKRIKYLALMMIALLLTLTSCGMSSSSSNDIKSINYQLLPDGRTMVTIDYVNERVQDAIFYIPKGEDGIGISGIYHTQSNDGKHTVVEITFSDEEMDPVFINVENGISVTGINSKFDDDGNTVITVSYSDGNTSEPITVLKGEKGDTGEDGEDGEDGVTLVNYSYVTNDDGSQDIVFIYSDGSEYPIHVPAPEKGEKGDNGLDGNGITGVASFEDDGKYYIYFTMSQSDPFFVEFTRPTEPNTWHQGNDEPEKSLGENGDYYFDVAHKIIYGKNNGKWSIIISLDQTQETCVVNFDLNDTLDSQAKLPSKYSVQYVINKGSTMYTSGYDVPEPTRDGYEFGGWYTTKSPSIVNGMFTDLTPITGDITLYAKWIELA